MVRSTSLVETSVQFSLATEKPPDLLRVQLIHCLTCKVEILSLNLLYESLDFLQQNEFKVQTLVLQTRGRAIANALWFSLLLYNVRKSDANISGYKVCHKEQYRSERRIETNSSATDLKGGPDPWRDVDPKQDPNIASLITYLKHRSHFET